VSRTIKTPPPIVLSPVYANERSASKQVGTKVREQTTLLNPRRHNSFECHNKTQ